MTDTIPPTIIVTSDTRRLSAFQTTTITFTLSEPSSNFTVGDVTVYGGTLSNFSGSGAVYTALYTPQFNGFVSVSNAAFTDFAGNVNADGAEINNSINLVVNQRPFANAGPRDYYVKTGASVSLNGGKSFDPDGDQLTYKWTVITKPIGSSPTLTNHLSAQPFFVADLEGNYGISLTVSDGLEDSGASFTTVMVSNVLKNYPPNADAGPTQYVKPGEAVTLNGINSYDLNGDQLTYRWSTVSTPSGSSPTLTNQLSAQALFVADMEGDYYITLIVNDGLLSSDLSLTRVQVSLPNTTPIANAGINQNVVIGKVTLDGSASFDTDGNKLTYKWYLVSKPNNSTATLVSPSSSKPTFTTDIAGEYVFTLVVNDGKVDSAPAPTVVLATLSSIPDTTSPTIAINSSSSSLGPSQTATITFTLSESSSNFVAGDVTVTGGTLSNFTGSGTSYTALFTPTANSTTSGTVSVASGVFTDAAGNTNADGYDANNSVSFSRIPTITNEIHTLAVIVDKNVLGASATLLKDLKESITLTNGAITKHIVEYSGLTFDYSQIDSLITTVTRDGEFTSEFTKEINDYLGAEQNITYSVAVAIVGAASIDGIILSVAGADGNFVG